MSQKRPTLRFKTGELAVVRPNFKIWGGRSHVYGPRIPGHTTLMTDKIEPGKCFLVLSDAKEAPKQNRKIYVEVMTDAGPKLVWACAFKMRKGKNEQR